MVDGYPSGCGCTRLFLIHTEITIILVVVENLKLFRKNCGVAVLGSSPFLDYQMLSNGCLSLKTRAPYLA